MGMEKTEQFHVDTSSNVLFLSGWSNAVGAMRKKVHWVRVESTHVGEYCHIYPPALLAAVRSSFSKPQSLAIRISPPLNDARPAPPRTSAANLIPPLASSLPVDLPFFACPFVFWQDQEKAWCEGNGCFFHLG